MIPQKKNLNRRIFLRYGVTSLIGLSTAAFFRKEIKVATKNISHGNSVWQIDPTKCVQCGRCATDCVIMPSAVKAVRAYTTCGYCDLCFGFFQLNTKSRTNDAENQLCPTAAITRTFIEEPYYEYLVDEQLCIGCAKCVKGCKTFGNGSFQLQIRHNLCLNCNECKIAVNCPGNAFKKVPASTPYLFTDGNEEAVDS